MESITFYDDDGRIVVSVSGDLSLADLSEWAAYKSINDSGSADTHYVLNGEIVERPENQATLNGLLISGIPCNGTLTIQGSDYAVTDTEVELDLPPGPNRLRLECFPYRSKTFEVLI